MVTFSLLLGRNVKCSLKYLNKAIIALLFQTRNVGRYHCQNSSFSVFFSRFPKSSKTGVVLVAAAGGCLVKLDPVKLLFLVVL